MNIILVISLSSTLVYMVETAALPYALINSNAFPPNIRVGFAREKYQYNIECTKEPPDDHDLGEECLESCDLNCDKLDTECKGKRPLIHQS